VQQPIRIDDYKWKKVLPNCGEWQRLHDQGLNSKNCDIELCLYMDSSDDEPKMRPHLPKYCHYYGKNWCKNVCSRHLLLCNLLVGKCMYSTSSGWIWK